MKNPPGRGLPLEGPCTQWSQFVLAWAPRDARNRRPGATFTLRAMAANNTVIDLDTGYVGARFLRTSDGRRCDGGSGAVSASAPARRQTAPTRRRTARPNSRSR